MPAELRAQTQGWDSAPYEVQVWLVVDGISRTRLGHRFLQRLEHYLEAYAESAAGACWHVQASACPFAVDGWGLPELEAWSTSMDATHASLLREMDKLVIVELDHQWEGTRVTVRQMDVATRRWNPAWRTIQSQAVALPATIARGLTETFSYTARIQTFADGGAQVVPRANLLLQADKPMARAKPGDLLRPVLRRNDRFGNPRADGIETLAWTVLEVKHLNPGAEVDCLTHSGVASPFPRRRSRRVDHFAVAIKVPHEATRLRFVARTDAHSVLPGLGIHARRGPADETRIDEIGTTDWHGEISIPRGGLRIIYVKQGNLVLARFPLVAGEQAWLAVPLPDEPARVEAEAYLTAIQDRLVDSVARRAVLSEEIAQAVENQELAEAESLFKSFQKLETREELLRELRLRQTTFEASDRVVQRRIDQLFNDARRRIQATATGLSEDQLRDAIRRMRADSVSAVPQK
jgi:hypothetical protein